MRIFNGVFSMKIFIVLFRVESSGDTRMLCEKIENHTFTTPSQPSVLDIDNAVRTTLDIDGSYSIEVEPISDFMDRVNDVEFNPNDYFMSYVKWSAE